MGMSVCLFRSRDAYCVILHQRHGPLFPLFFLCRQARSWPSLSTWVFSTTSLLTLSLYFPRSPLDTRLGLCCLFLLNPESCCATHSLSYRSPDQNIESEKETSQDQQGQRKKACPGLGKEREKSWAHCTKETPFMCWGFTLLLLHTPHTPSSLSYGI